ncbi:uncharacterized protein LODBEIA_P51670 [Lodderomyces beijingensis]|uniref:GOLD domain-containing protein n=1 Tax=Lodderomyces beijingensis TaxID=1775926 RepID=A0ABP0ZS21_9ASCO
MRFGSLRTRASLQRLYCIFHFPLLLLLLQPPRVCAIGVQIEPLKNIAKNHNQKSSLSNLHNCVSYETAVRDIIFLTISEVANLPSQELNLLVLDNRGNVLLNQLNLGKFNRKLELIVSKSDERSGLVHVCFDNLYNDLSWSFQPRAFEFQVSVNIKNDIQVTDYGIYKQYFSYMRSENDNKGEVDEKGFDVKMNMVQLDLDNIVEKLVKSYETTQELLEQEFKLRDTNEEIFTGYTLISIVLCWTIFIAGVVQLIYFQCYLRRKNVV